MIKIIYIYEFYEVDFLSQTVWPIFSLIYTRFLYINLYFYVKFSFFTFTILL